jgi:acetylornithine/N-succinyldiaminopimelate aminotransferase
MSSLFPTYAKWPITAVKAKGSRLWDSHGKEYIDFVSGIAVCNLGHAPDQVKEKLKDQLDQIWHCCNLFYHHGQEKLADRLTDISCMDAVFLCNSGAEANEAAIKLARRYSQKVLGRDRYEVVTFHQSFHGRTLATLTATGQDKVKEGFLPLPEGFRSLPYNDKDALKDAVTDKTCAILLELVQGEGGVHPADPEWLQEIVSLCKRHDLLLMIDEIQTGMGRTGKMFAYEHYGIEPDVITLAKGLGSGFPVGAMLGKAKTVDAFTAGSHGTTFGGNPLATAAALATVETIVGEGIVDQAAQSGEYLIGQLTELLEDNPFVKEIRGKGLIIGIECAEPIGSLVTEAQTAGLLVIPAGPHVIRLLPPLNVAKEDLDQAIGILTTILAKRSPVYQG